MQQRLAAWAAVFAGLALVPVAWAVEEADQRLGEAERPLAEGPFLAPDTWAAPGPGRYGREPRRPGLLGGPHDLSHLNDAGQVCVYCHTPHAGADRAPLWDRAGTESTFRMYRRAPHAEDNLVVASQPGPESLVCLGCHDGTLALDARLPGAGAAAAALAGEEPFSPEGPVGTDLSDDHPVSVTYAPEQDGSLAPREMVTQVLPLFGPGRDQVECATCHEPHGGEDEAFLRTSNRGSALCLTCHRR